MVSSIKFQGRELDIDNLLYSVGPDVGRLIQNRLKKNEIAMTGSSSSREVDLFSNIKLPVIKPYEYVRRKLEYEGVIQYQKDTCWQSFETHLAKFIYLKKDHHDIFAITFNEKCGCTSGGTCGQSIEKISKIFEDDSFHHGSLSSSTERPDRKTRVVALDDNNNPVVQFESFCSHVKPYTVHWLHASPSGFVWEKTENGSVASLRSHLSTVIYDEDSFLSCFVQHTRKRVICITGVAGIGKTTFLQATAANIKAKHEHRLVCYMTCKRLGEILKNLHDVNGVKSMSSLVLIEVLAREFSLKRKLEKKILKCMISTCDNGGSPKIELFLDGVEDLNPRYRKMLLTYLKEEQQWCFRIWLTARTHLKHLIEDELNLIAYELCYFTKTDIVSCFRRVSDYCSSNHEFCPCKNIGKVMLAEVLVSTPLESYLKIDLVGILAIPRHLKSVFKVMMQSRIINPFLLTAWEIMKAVIEGVIEAYLDKHTSREERNNAEEKVPGIMKKYASLSAQLYFQKRLGNGDLLDLLCNADPDLYEFGLIERNRESKVWFVHNAFPGYLLADYFTIVSPSNKILIEFFLYQVLYEDVCEDVRMFYDQKLKTEKVDVKILDAWGEVIQKFLVTFHNLSDDSFKHGGTFMYGTALHLAIIDERIEIAKLLVKSLVEFPEELRRLINRKMKVKIEVNDYEATTVVGNETEKSVELSALSLAIMFGDTDLIKGMYTLLEDNEHAVNVEDDSRVESCTSLDYYNFTPTHLAVISCNMASFLYLSSERRLSINVSDLRGHLPIHLIFYNRWNFQFLILPPDHPKRGHVFREINICKYYNDTDKDRGDVNVKDRSGRYPILASDMTTPLTQMMMKRNLNFESKNDEVAVKTTTHYKCALSYVKFMEKLAGRTFLNFKHAVYPSSSSIAPPLHLACISGYMPMIKCMITKGVKINIKDRNELTALFYAVFYGRVDITKYLLKNGINRSDLKKWVDEAPLLHNAALKGHLEMVKYMIIDLCISKNITNDEGLTALHKVCQAGRLDSINLLVEMNSDVNAKDKQEQTPLHLACSTGANVNVEIVKLLINCGADVNCKTNHGKTALHLVAEEGNVELLKVLFKTGSMDPNVTTNHGRTPLHFACSKPGNLGTVKFLVACGANVNAADVNGQTPMHLMAVCHADSGMAEFLIRAGGNVYVKDSCGETPLSELQKHNEELFRVVIEQINYVPCRYIKEARVINNSGMFQ